jgi:hypothetical protein
MFTDTVNSLSATFSSSADPGGFVVYQSMFETLTGSAPEPGTFALFGVSLMLGGIPAFRRRNAARG